MLLATLTVVVELFTSEGCSSCPPADAVLGRLQQTQPVPGVEILTLGEHVDYWNSEDFRDPFSAQIFTERQSRYGSRLYTPQAVVQGRTDVLGSDEEGLKAAIRRAIAQKQGTIQLARDRDAIRIQVEGAEGEVVLAIVEDGLVSEVKRGENAGRTLRHESVVRSLRKVKPGTVPLLLDPSWKKPRAVVFVQGKDGIQAAAGLGL